MEIVNFAVTLIIDEYESVPWIQKRSGGNGTRGGDVGHGWKVGKIDDSDRVLIVSLNEGQGTIAAEGNSIGFILWVRHTLFVDMLKAKVFRDGVNVNFSIAIPY